MSFEMTPDVQAWSSGVRANLGWDPREGRPGLELADLISCYCEARKAGYINCKVYLWNLRRELF
jgi:hypothetical protein